MRPEYPDVYGAITTGVTAREAAGIPEGSRLPGICHLTGTAQVIPHNRNLPPVKVWRAVSLDSYARQGKVRFCRRFAGSVIIASAFSLKIKYTAYIRNFLPGK